MSRAISLTQRQADRESRGNRARPWWRVALLAFWLGILVGTLAGRVPLTAGSILQEETGPARPCPHEGRTITVQAGDTLWALARKYAPVGNDTRASVSLLMEWNDLNSCVIQPGQVLFIPPGSNDPGLEGH